MPIVKISPPAKLYRRENWRYLYYEISGIGFMGWDKATQTEIAELPTAEACDAFLLRTSSQNEEEGTSADLEAFASMRQQFEEAYPKLMRVFGVWADLPANPDNLDICWSPIRIELYAYGKELLQLVWDGTSEDPTTQVMSRGILRYEFLHTAPSEFAKMARVWSKE